MLKLDELSIKDTVEIKNPDTETDGEKINANTLSLLQSCDFRGEVAKIEDGYVYVGFITDNGWVTQIFKPDELREVEQID